ncbi:TlpA family protein disulfide reductase [Maribacter sp. R77961]|uniref:TlpA family protein disulfide reductase n=1 Tax=Maribacter sp. R77961 TaxID=3093871 RepID=UPI0037CB1ED7
MKKRKFSFSDILFVVFIGLLLFPQTRTPIQVALNKVRVAVFSPSVLDGEERTQLQPFTYRVATMDGAQLSVPIGDGKITFISYWATWCPPCIAELPSIQKLHADYGEQVTFLLLTNEKPETVKRFLKKKALDLPVFIPQMKAPEALYETSIPTNYVLDQKGKIIIKETGAANWNSKRVRQLLNNLLQE